MLNAMFKRIFNFRNYFFHGFESYNYDQYHIVFRVTKAKIYGISH